MAELSLDDLLSGLEAVQQKKSSVRGIILHHFNLMPYKNLSIPFHVTKSVKPVHLICRCDHHRVFSGP